jgi:hypothetical protein
VRPDELPDAILWGVQRQREAVIAANAELRERELIKMASPSAAPP